MKVNYVLMYGTPYLKYREFETFDDISKFLINKSIVNYTIFEKMQDNKEVEMIYLNNDIKVLKQRIDKAIENVPKTDNINLTSAYNSINVEDLADAVDRFKKLPTYDELLKENQKYKEVIDKAIEYIKNASYFDGSGMCANDLLAILGGK